MKIVVERMKKPDDENYALRGLKDNTLYGIVFCDLFWNPETKKNEFNLAPGKSAVVDITLDYELE